MKIIQQLPSCKPYSMTCCRIEDFPWQVATGWHGNIGLLPLSPILQNYLLSGFCAFYSVPAELVIQLWFAMLLLWLTGKTYLWTGWLIAVWIMIFFHGFDTWNVEMSTRLEGFGQAIQMLYGGRVPKDLAELLKLAGIS